MTVGPMICQGCRCKVWYQGGAYFDRGSPNGFKRHSCKPAHAARISNRAKRTWTDEYRRAYKRDWNRRNRPPRTTHRWEGGKVCLDCGITRGRAARMAGDRAAVRRFLEGEDSERSQTRRVDEL